MALRNLFLSAVVLAFSSTSFAGVDPNSKTMDQFFEAMNIEQMMSESVQKLVAAQSRQNPDIKKIEKEYIEFLQRTTSFKANEKAIRALYADRFTESELKDMTVFYRSPTGKKTIAIMPELTTEAMLIGQNRVQAELPAFLKSIEAKLKATKK